MGLPGAIVERLLDPVPPGAPVGGDARVEGDMDRPRQLGGVLPRRVDIETVTGNMRPHNAQPSADVGVRDRIFPLES